jgi:hypothetical protein
MFPFNLVLKDKYYILKLTRTCLDVSINNKLLEAISSHIFYIVSLYTAVLYSCSVKAIRYYIEHYREEESNFKEIIHLATPVLYFAIERNLPNITSLLLKLSISLYSVDNEAYYILPLVFAVIYRYL